MLDLISMCVVAKHMLLQAGEGSFPLQERAVGVSLQPLLLTGQENFYLKSFGSVARSIEFPLIYFRITDYGIVIVRVLHERMDASRHL